MERKKIGLALSGGGARGFAHVGVLKVLAAHNIPIDMVAGTSAGSIVGGALAAGMSVDEIVAMTRKVRFTNMMRPSFSIGGMLSNAPMGHFLTSHFPVARFEDLAIPFAAVAYDPAKGKTVILKDTGDLITAIRASCAVPGLFAPVKDADGRRLVDGGVTMVMPVDVVREMGAEIVIAVDVLTCGERFESSARNGLSIGIRSVLALIRATSLHQHQNADLVIVPQIAHLRPDQIGRRDEFIDLGEQAAQLHIDAIKDLINTEQ